MTEEDEEYNVAIYHHELLSTLSEEDLEFLRIEWLRQWREDIKKTPGSTPMEIAMDKHLITSIDIILCYFGAAE